MALGASRDAHCYSIVPLLLESLCENPRMPRKSPGLDIRDLMQVKICLDIVQALVIYFLFRLQRYEIYTGIGQLCGYSTHTSPHLYSAGTYSHLAVDGLRNRKFRTREQSDGNMQCLRLFSTNYLLRTPLSLPCNSSAFALFTNSFNSTIFVPSGVIFTNRTHSVHHSVIPSLMRILPMSLALLTFPPILQCAITVSVSFEKCTWPCGAILKSSNNEKIITACCWKFSRPRGGRLRDSGRTVCEKSLDAFAPSAAGRSVVYALSSL
jgi:hypothetical protein